MTEHRNHTRQAPQQTDYSAAVARAVEWLGDRYLLAKPLTHSHQRIRHASGVNGQH
ncbi:MAG TPA: hypothetical protein VGI65_15525 [Steroidobacteraceae bacterium]|jgi:hypothetical protein